MSGFIIIVSGFASGVFLRSLFSFEWQPIAFVFLLTLLFAGAAISKSRRVYSFGAIFFLLVAFGMVRASVADTPLPDTFARDIKQRVSYEGVVVSSPDMRDTNQRVEIRVTKFGETTRVLAVAPRYPRVSFGDRVYVTGTLTVPEAFADDNGRVFHYDKYLQRDGVRFILNFAFIRVEAAAPWYSILAALAQVKRAFQGGIAATLPEPHASLASGITIGGKSGLGNDLKEVFVRSGLIHIVVLSGYNVMIVAEMIIAALALTRLPRQWGAVAGAFALLVFVGIAGVSTTAVRAALMALIALYARATGRSYAAGRALLVVIFCMLLWNPLYLAFDPGFGLSVAATAGIIWLAPIIEVFLLSKMNGSFWKNIIATTLAAQLAVLPLLLYVTGNLSLVAIPAGLLALPLIPLAMGFSALAGIVGIVFGSFAPLLGIIGAFPAYLATAYLLFIAKGAAVLPFAAFTLPPFPFWLVIAAYAGLLYFVSSKRFSTTDQLRFAKNASI